MNTKSLLCGATLALLLSVSLPAQEPGPRPGGYQAPNMERLRAELRSMPPAQRRALLRELQDQNASTPAAPGGRPFAVQPQVQARGPAAGMAAGAAPGAAPGPNRINAVLTPEQRQSMREANEENRDKIRDLQDELRDARQAVTEATFAGTFKESTLRKKLQAAAKLETELAILRARALSKIDPPLSAEQIEQLKNPPPAAELQRNPQFGGIQRPAPNGQAFRNNLPPAGRPGRQGQPGSGQRPPPGQF